MVIGGMFDPPHLGHMAMIAAATVPGDDIWIIVAGVPPHRTPPVASSSDRLRMVAAAVQHAPELADRSVHVSDMEVARGDEVSYTVDTVRALSTRALPGRPVLVVGDEHAAGITTWHAWDVLLDMVDLAVVTRTGIAEQGSDVAQRVELCAAEHGARVWWCSMVPVPASSTDIRRLVEAGDIEAAAREVPAGVAPLLDDVYRVIRHR